MFRLIYRQRRRLGVTAFFFALGTAVFLYGLQAVVLGQIENGWIWPLTVALTALACGLAAALIGAAIILLLPLWRTICEVLAIVFFLTSTVTAFFPAMPGVFEAMLPFIMVVIVNSLMYGDWLDRARFWLDHRQKRSFTSPKTPEELWDILVPDPQTLDAHWDPILHRMTPLEDEDDAFDVRYTHGASLYEHQTMTFLDRDWPHHARYHHVGEIDPRNRAITEGIYDIRIAPRDLGGSTVTITAERVAMVPRAGLLNWFDDDLGSSIDFIRARDAGRRDWSTAGTYRRAVEKLA